MHRMTRLIAACFKGAHTLLPLLVVVAACGGEGAIGSGDGADNPGGDAGSGSGGSASVSAGSGGSGSTASGDTGGGSGSGGSGSGGGGGGSMGGSPWSIGFGNAQDQQGLAVAVDASGNVVVTGMFLGTVDFGGGPLTAEGDYDVFVAKYDADGNHLWSKHYGNSFAQIGRAIAVDSEGNIVVAGEFEGSINFGGNPLAGASNSTSDVFVAKLGPGGDHVWSQRFGDPSPQVAYAIAADGGDNVIVAGSMRGVVQFGSDTWTSAGGDDVFLMKLDAEGAPLWGAKFGGSGHQIARGVAVDAEGNMFLTGEADGSINFGGQQTSHGDPDFFYAVFAPNGSHRCSYRSETGSRQIGYAIAVGPDGAAVVTGDLRGTIVLGQDTLKSTNYSDVFVAKADADCNWLWSDRFGTGTYRDQIGYGISTDREGAVWVTGAFEGSIDFGGGTLPSSSAGRYDVFVARFDAAGAHLFSERAGDADHQIGRAIAGGLSGYAVVAGSYRGNVDFSGHAVIGSTNSSGSSYDVFVSSIVP